MRPAKATREDVEGAAILAGLLGAAALTAKLGLSLRRRVELRDLDRLSAEDERRREQDLAYGEQLARQAGARSPREWAYRAWKRGAAANELAAQAARDSMYKPGVEQDIDARPPTDLGYYTNDQGGTSFGERGKRGRGGRRRPPSE